MYDELLKATKQQFDSRTLDENDVTRTMQMISRSNAELLEEMWAIGARPNVEKLLRKACFGLANIRLARFLLEKCPNEINLNQVLVLNVFF